MIDMPQLTKRVTMIELFYDLLFAYMISQATSLIHHLEHGMVSTCFVPDIRSSRHCLH